MAEFCKQCHVDVMGFDPNDPCDLAGLSTPEDSANGLYANVICEGCGFVQVDHLGRCIGGSACMEGHSISDLVIIPTST